MLKVQFININLNLQIIVCNLDVIHHLYAIFIGINLLIVHQKISKRITYFFLQEQHTKNVACLQFDCNHLQCIDPKFHICLLSCLIDVKISILMSGDQVIGFVRTTNRPTIYQNIKFYTWNLRQRLLETCKATADFDIFS